MREIRIPGIRRVLRLSWSESRVGRDVAEEIRFHLDARTEELIHLGVPATEARERASAEYGDVELSQLELAEVDRRRLGNERNEERLMSFHDDLKYAARSLSRRPTLLFVTTLTLALGIAANAIMFGVVDQLLLRAPAHIAAPEALRRINYRDHGQGETNIGAGTTYLTLPALRMGATAFAELSAYSYPSQYSLGRGRDAQSVAVQLVSGNFFRLLGVSPAAGRIFSDYDDRIPVGEPVAILSYGLWRREFGGDTSVIGRPVLLQGKTFTVVGIAPRGFAGVDRDKIDIWLPLSSYAKEAIGDGWYNTTDNWWAQIIARLRADASPEVAEGQATAAYRALVRGWRHPWRDSTSSVVLSSIIGTRTPNGLSRESKVSLWLTGVSVIVLLIACANVANLLIVRAVDRRREISVRLALGISRGRLVRMLLTEAGLLAALAGIGALGIAFVASHLVQRILLPNIAWSESVIDARMLAFTFAITAVCMLLAGLAPALQGLGTKVSEGLKASSRQVAGGSGKLRFTLMLAQAALSVMLLIGAGLFVKSLRNVASREVGIDRDRVLRVTMPLARFGFDSAQVEGIFSRGAERVRQIPGVASVAVARLTYPMGNASASRFVVTGMKRHKFESGPYNAVVTAGFFSTVGAKLIEGRDFTLAEERSPARVVIINEGLAKGYWPNGGALGKCVQFGVDSACSQVVGIASTVLQFNLINDDRAIAYVPPRHPGVRDAPPGAMLVRVSGDPAAVAALVTRELQSLSTTMPFVQVKSYSALVAPQLQPWRLGAMMFTLFGAIALIIAAVGLYSVMAYWVSQRTHEIGIRMALGAGRADVVRLVAVQSSRAVIAGLIIGGGAAFIATRWIGDMLFDTSPRDPLVYGGAALVLAVAATIASVVPVRRSTAVDPALAIRSE